MAANRLSAVQPSPRPLQVPQPPAVPLPPTPLYLLRPPAAVPLQPRKFAANAPGLVPAHSASAADSEPAPVPGAAAESARNAAAAAPTSCQGNLSPVSVPPVVAASAMERAILTVAIAVVPADAVCAAVWAYAEKLEVCVYLRR